MFQGWVNKQQLNAYHHLHTYITSSVTLRWLQQQQQQQLYYNDYCVDMYKTVNITQNCLQRLEFTSHVKWSGAEKNENTNK